MKIHATFANRKYDPEVVELVHAWDEFCVDENPRGYNDSLRDDLASWGEDLLRWVTVEIDVEAAAIYEALDPRRPTVRGEVSHIGEVTTPAPQARAGESEGADRG
ncbi:MAG: hypothetical protein ACXVGA_08555 [Mycobacteriaceae bacterium]